MQLQTPVDALRALYFYQHPTGINSLPILFFYYLDLGNELEEAQTTTDQAVWSCRGGNR